MRFNGFKWSVAKIVLAIILGLITFWPQYGVVFLAASDAQTHPLLTTAFGSIWVVLLALILPFPLRWFTRITTLACIVLLLTINIAAYRAKLIDPTTITFYLTYGVVEIFAIFGWLMCVSPLWKSFHGIVAVQQTPDEEEHHE